MAFRLRCPECRQTFPWSGDYPDACPLCEAHIGSGREDNDICMPSIRHARTVIHDRVYRDMERGSEHRVELAAEQLGVPKSELSHLKITNMNEATRPGDVAAIPVNNVVSQAMAAAPGLTGFQGANGIGYSGPVQISTSPKAQDQNAGARFQTLLREEHGKRTNFTAVGDRPALETLQPGYRRRA